MADRLPCAWCWESEVGKRVCPSCGMQCRGAFLQTEWNIPVEQTLFHRDGTWWHEPDRYPCAFSEPSGYVIFENKAAIDQTSHLKIEASERVNLKADTLSSIPGYIRVSKPIIEEVFIEEDLFPEEHGPEGSVYLITNEAWKDWVKIGSSFDPEKRLKNYQTGDPYRKYRLIDEREFPDRREAEFAIHEMLKSEGFLSEGEWFEISTSEAKARLHGFRT